MVRNQWRPYDELRLDQEKQLRGLIDFSYRNVPYYHDLFKSLGLSSADIQTIQDLEKIPILTKEDIRNNWDALKPVNLASMRYGDRATGGTSGTPMSYRISKHDRFLGGALLYRGWGHGGFDLGDRVAFLAGSSLGVSSRSTIAKKIHERARNIRKLSSFDMSDLEMTEYAKLLASFRPQYLRGYPTSIYYFSCWLRENNTMVPPIKSVFTTAEKLLPKMRSVIEDTLDCEVFDNYGLNDGGVSAYECREHDGLHIDTERSIMEVVDGDHRQVECGEGQILATSLNNYAMPFIRYATGDEGRISQEKCGCGRGHLLLEEVIGRTTDMLTTPEGKNVHGWFFLYIFWEHGNGIKEYQVLQKTKEHIVIKIVPSADFNEKVFDDILMAARTRSRGWQITFQIVEAIERSSAGKYKFIINEVPNEWE